MMIHSPLSVNTMAIDALALYITKASTAMDGIDIVLPEYPGSSTKMVY